MNTSSYISHVDGGRWSVVGGQWSVISDRWSVTSDYSENMLRGAVTRSGQFRLATGRECRVLVALLLFVALTASACVDKEQSQKLMKSFETGPQHPDEAPKMLNKELPFHYPPTLYARKVQGNVTLRLFIDRDGRVRPDSTQIVESSGYASFDSAAIRGSQELQFVPAKTKGEPQAVTILFPVYFRFPGAPPLPGDTVLRKK